MTTDTVATRRRAKENSAYQTIDALIAKTGLELAPHDYQSLRAVLYRWASFETLNGWEKIKKAVEG